MITVTITKTLEPWAWGTDDELGGLSDKELVELLMEDLLAVVDGAMWEITRTEKKNMKSPIERPTPREIN